MEQRQGQQQQPRRAGAAACEGEPAAVVQRTQVLLLAGEPWGPDGGQRVLSSFQQTVLPPPGDGPGPGPLCASPPPPPALAAPGPPAAGQLIFFLCRAASLRERPERLREALQGVRDQSRAATAALVGVLVQPRPDEEREARRHLEQLLRDVFLEHDGAAAAAPGLELHTAVFAPGRPDGALELRRLAEHKAVSNFGLDKMRMMQIFGAVLSFGTMAYGGYYLYNNPPV